MNAQQWIERLGLAQHPEGGYFREIYRSPESVAQSALPERFDGDRCFSTSIYYLLNRSDVSHFHRIRQDEIWHFYDGAPMMVYTIQSKRCTVFRLGRNPNKGQLPMLVIPKGTIFAAEVEDKRSYSMVGCTVSPGFEFADFELLDRGMLSQTYPEHIELIRKFTKS